MQRIVIIGCSGSGKSTLTRILGQRLGLPVTHLDQVFWRAGWVNVDRETFDAKLAQTLETPAWIIDGNFGRTLVWRLSRCDTAIYLDYPRALCLYGVFKARVIILRQNPPRYGIRLSRAFGLGFS